MKRAGVPTSIIRELMGHSSESVTQIYLDSFDNEQDGRGDEELALNYHGLACLSRNSSYICPNLTNEVREKD